MKNKMKIAAIFRLHLLSLLFLAFSGQMLQAQTTWVGGTDNNWTTDANWNTNMEPTASDDVIIPAGFTVVISTNVSAQSINTSGNLSITFDGVLNIDGSTFRGLGNVGTVTNNGTINMGLNSHVGLNGIVNQNGGSFLNNGSIITGDVAVPGRSVVFTSSTGTFTNNGNIEIGYVPGSDPVFGLTVLGSGLFVNNGTITNDQPSQAIRIAPQGADSPELQNNGVITTAGGIFINLGQFNNTACAELYAVGFNIADASATVNNSGLMQFSNNSTNNGTWNNMGTIHRESETIISSSSILINNDDLIILDITLTNNCGELSPAFEVGPNLGSTVSIYTDAAATMSAGTYDSGTNTYIPNFVLSNTTYNLFVKVEDNATTNPCVDYILPWALTVVTAPCCNLTTWTGSVSTDWDDANNWDTYLVPTACNDVSILATTNQPIIDGSTNALAMSVEVAANATLVIDMDGVLNIDGSTFRGLGNVGTVTNNGTINMGLNSHVGLNGIVNQNGGSFLNNGSIITGDVAEPGRSVVFTSSTGTFTNNGNIEIGYVPGSNPVFGLTVLGSGLFVNNGTITNDQPSQAIRIAPQGADSPELQNNGVITTSGGIFINLGQFNNTACAELYAVGFNIADASATVNNSGLMQFSNNSTNSGTWNNMGTIHRESEIIVSSSSTPINNDDLVILDITLTNNCGELSPAFGIGSNLGSTVSIYTNAAATMSAGTYDSGTNTFTPNFVLSNTTYNLFVKVEDNATTNPCVDYILPWALTVVTAPCCNLTTWTGSVSTDWDDANNWDTYLVPTACNDVSILATTNQPIIDGSTNALAMSVEVAANATLVIDMDGVLNIDGSTFRGLGNVGTVTNNGTINMGLNSHVGLNGIVNQNGGSFMNNSSIITGDVADPGRSVVFTSSTGTFTNNGNIEIGYVPGSNPVFGLTVLGSGLFVNNGTITNDQPSQAIRIAPQGADSPELQNNGVITTSGGIFINLGQFNNTACAELYAVGFNIADASATVNNSGLMQFSNNSTNNGTWNNMGTIHRESETIISSSSIVINNDDLIILDITLTEDCGTLSPAFGIGSNLGSTVSIYTNAAGTMSAGTYDSGTNTFTPNFALSNTTYNLFVKVVDANGCNPYILPWNLTVNSCTDTDNDNLCDSCDPDDDNDGQTDVDEIACGSDPLLASSLSPDNDGDNSPDCVDIDDDNDGVDDVNDAFPFDLTETTDTDGDGIGNNADTDDDNDGQTDVDEIACGSNPLLASSLSPDNDGDNSPDCVDMDDDNDGVDDVNDAFPFDLTETTDTDGDGIGNNADTDDDNDGQSDEAEIACGYDPLSATSNLTNDDTNLFAYVMIARKEVKIKESDVQSGGVGVWQSGKKAKVQDNSNVSSFVKAPVIDQDNSSTIGTSIIGQANVSLPVFRTNTMSSNLDLKVNDNQTKVINVGDPIAYDKIEVKKNATLIVRIPELYAKEIKTKDGATIIFENMQGTEIMLEKKLDLDKNNTFNSTGMDVFIYTEEKMDIKEGSDFTGNVYALKKIQAKGKIHDETYMTGIFISDDKIQADKHTTWNWNPGNCDWTGGSGSGSGFIVDPNQGISTYNQPKTTLDIPAQIDIFPNPASQVVNIQLKGIKGKSNIVIYNQIGSIIWTQQLAEDQSKFQLNLNNSKFTNGVYMVSVVSDDETLTKRLVISK